MFGFGVHIVKNTFSLLRFKINDTLHIPQVNGYNVYKADLHTHTIFSDGQACHAFLSNAWQVFYTYCAIRMPALCRFL